MTTTYHLRSGRPLLFMLILATALAGALELQAQPGCSSTAGVAQVAVDLIRDGAGDPIVETKDLTRREHARITSGLRDALEITVPSDPDEDVRPQIRVIVETSTLPSGLRSTATFTVEEVIENTAAYRVEIYDVDPAEVDPMAGDEDEDSGTFKLFESAGFDPTATLTVQAVAPSRTEVDAGGSPTVTQNFCEPSENHDPVDSTDIYGSFENVKIRSPRDFVLLAPHSGMIEEGTGEQIAEIEAAMAARGLSPSIWESTSRWDSDLASERFHITSKAFDPQSFPGLAELLAAGDYDAAQGVEFQHAGSVHGFGPYDGNGIIVGGRASFETKCYVARQIQERIADAGEDAIAFFVYPPDGDPNGALNLPDEGGGLITDQRSNVGVSGHSCDNVVNRLTQNANCSAGVGGIQLEQSWDLRQDPTIRGLVSQGIADGFADMILDPTLIDPATTTYCDALVGAATNGHGQIGDTVWVDLDADGIQDPGEPVREGVTVELLESGVEVASTTTSTLGRYVFGSLDAATYVVRFTVPAGYTFSPANQGGDGAVDSDVIIGGETAAIVLDAGETLLDIDAGLVPDGTSAEIGDFVWQDEDGNGVYDAGEAGLEGILVELETALGTPVAATTTDVSGNYLFTGLLPGDYVVRFSASGWVATTASTVGPFSLAADAVDTTRDAGFKSSCEDYALIAFGSSWTFPGAGGSWSATWNQDTFDDSTWDSGHGLLGFSTSKTVQTTVPNDATTVTYYFRHTFEVDDATLVQALDLEIERDDGAVVYLNGQEVMRSNLPAGAIDATTRAIDSSWARETASLDPGLLHDGSNLLAVEIHQRYIGSTADFAFDLELRAKSCDPCRVGTLELAPVADTYLREDDPTDDNGNNSGLWADGGTDEGRAALFAWDLSQAPSGVTVLGAEILLEVLDDTSAYYPLYALETAWSEDDATWNEAQPNVAWDAPGAQGSLDRDDAMLGVAHQTGGGPYTLSFTAAGRQQVADWMSGATHHGLVVASGSSTNGLKVGSRESATPPLLRVVYSQTCNP